MIALLPLALSPALGADGLDGLDDGLDESAGGGAGRCGRGLLLRPPCDTGLSEVFGSGAGEEGANEATEEAARCAAGRSARESGAVGSRQVGTRARANPTATAAGASTRATAAAAAAGAFARAVWWRRGGRERSGWRQRRVTTTPGREGGSRGAGGARARMARQRAGEGLAMASWGCVVGAGGAAARGEERDNAPKMGEVAASWTRHGLQGNSGRFQI